MDCDARHADGVTIDVPVARMPGAFALREPQLFFLASALISELPATVLKQSFFWRGNAMAAKAKAQTVPAAGNKPVMTFRARGVKVSIWENLSTNGEGERKFYKTAIQRVYKEG